MEEDLKLVIRHELKSLGVNSTIDQLLRVSVYPLTVRFKHVISSCASGDHAKIACNDFSAFAQRTPAKGISLANIFDWNRICFPRICSNSRQEGLWSHAKPWSCCRCLHVLTFGEPTEKEHRFTCCPNYVIQPCSQTNL
jgi:hypothetical protein